MKVCPECKSSKLVRDYERGELVCSACGLVVGDGGIEMTKTEAKAVEARGACALCGKWYDLSEQKLCPKCQDFFNALKPLYKRAGETALEEVKDEIENVENALDDLKDAFEKLKDKADE